jgi:hypothetical protein
MGGGGFADTQTASLSHKPTLGKWAKQDWREQIAYFPLIRPGPHRKRHIQKFFYCVCIRCRGNVFTEQLPGNDRGIHIKTHRLIGGIYEVRHWDGLRCHDIHTKFHKDWLRHSMMLTRKCASTWLKPQTTGWETISYRTFPPSWFHFLLV